MAKRFDGSGVVIIQCSEGAYASLKLAEMPVPRDYGEIVDGRRRVILDTRSMGADSQRYRVIWPEPSNGPGSKNRSSGFSLSAAHVNETLFVLAEFLRDQGVDFVKLANVHGNGLTDLRLSGSNLAYLTRGIPHSPACHVNFFTAEAPELSGSSGGVIHAPTLDSKAD